MIVITTSIEIDALPSAVRAAFLDFPSIEYSPKGYITYVQALDDASRDKPSSGLQPGAKLQCHTGGITVTPTILANDANEFTWGASPWPAASFSLLTADAHRFKWEDSATAPGKTTFVQEEEFSGPLSFVFGEGMLGVQRMTQTKWFNDFNADLKQWVESKAGGKS